MRWRKNSGAGDWNRSAVSRIIGVQQKERSMSFVKNGMRSVVGGAVLLMASVSGGQSVRQPVPHAHIYPDVQAAHTDIQAALAKARAEHKRVLVDFGGDWCG